MPKTGMDVGIGQPSMRYIPTSNMFSPSDTNATDKVIVAMAPLRYSREGTAGYSDRVALCEEDDVPELFSTQRMAQANAPIGVIQLPKTSEITGSFQLDLSYVGDVPAGDDLSILAAGPQTLKVVNDGSGVGRVLKAAVGRMTVQF